MGKDKGGGEMWKREKRKRMELGGGKGECYLSSSSLATCHHRRPSRQKTCALSHSPDVCVCIQIFFLFCFFLFFLLLCVDFTGCQDASFP